MAKKDKRFLLQSYIVQYVVVMYETSPCVLATVCRLETRMRFFYVYIIAKIPPGWYFPRSLLVQSYLFGL
jgi:hypothetical protein